MDEWLTGSPDIDRFRRAFDADLGRAAQAGLTLSAFWQSDDDPLDVHFLLAAEDRARAEAFMASEQSAASGEAAGVVDGDYHWLVGAVFFAPPEHDHPQD